MYLLECERSTKDRTDDNPFFAVLASGPFKPSNIEFTFNPTPISYPDFVKERIATVWREIKANNTNAFPGKMVRLDSFSKNDNKLILNLGTTRYDEYRGTLALTEEEKRRANYELANPLAACLLVYSDTAYKGRGVMLFCLRSNDVVHRPNALEIPSGNVALVRGVPEDPIRTAIRECTEERGILPEEIENIEVSALIYEYYQDAAAMLVCSARLKESVQIADITKRKTDSESNAVWLQLDAVHNLSNLLLALSYNTLPSCLAAYYFHLQNHVSKDKAENFLEKLKTQKQKKVSTMDLINNFLTN